MVVPWRATSQVRSVKLCGVYKPKMVQVRQWRPKYLFRAWDDMVVGVGVSKPCIRKQKFPELFCWFQDETTGVFGVPKIDTQQKITHMRKPSKEIQPTRSNTRVFPLENLSDAKTSPSNSGKWRFYMHTLLQCNTPGRCSWWPLQCSKRTAWLSVTKGPSLTRKHTLETNANAILDKFRSCSQ